MLTQAAPTVMFAPSPVAASPGFTYTEKMESKSA